MKTIATVLFAVLLLAGCEFSYRFESKPMEELAEQPAKVIAQKKQASCVGTMQYRPRPDSDNPQILVARPVTTYPSLGTGYYWNTSDPVAETKASGALAEALPYGTRKTTSLSLTVRDGEVYLLAFNSKQPEMEKQAWGWTGQRVTVTADAIPGFSIGNIDYILVKGIELETKQP